MAQLQGTTVAGDLNVDESGGVAPLFVDSGDDIVATNFDTTTNFSGEATNTGTDILSSGFIETQSGFVGDGSQITNFDLRNLSDVNDDVDNRPEFPDLPSIATTTTPSKDSDLTTKTYVDGVAQGLEVKDSTDVATDGTNIDLTSSSGPSSIDGITISDGEFVLLKDQTTASENGIYVANTASDPSTWTRREDFDEDSEVQAGAFTFVEKGNVNGDTAFVVTSDDPITVGTDDIIFSVFASAGQITAGDGLKQSGNTFNIEPDDFAGRGLQDDGNDDLEIVDATIQDAVFNNVLTGTQTLITVTYDDTNNEVSYVVQDDLSQYSFANVTTDDIGEGATNLYFTDERAQDAVGTILGTNLTYDDAAPLIEIDETALAGNGLVDDGNDNLELDIGVEDSGTDVSATTSIFELNFGSGLAVTDNTGTTAGKITIDVDSSTATNITVEDSGTDVVSGIDNLDFGTNLNVTDNTGVEAGEAIIDAVDTRTNVSDDGTQVLTDTTDINFGTDLGVTDDGDGSVTVDFVGTSDLVDVSDDGTQVLANVTDINFSTNLSVTDDGDGTVTVTSTDTNTTDITVEDSGTDVVSGIDNLDFGTNLSVTDNTGTEAGEAIIDATDTRTNVSDDGTQVVADTDDINFGTNVSVTDDGDGSVTVDATDTRTNVSDNGTQVVAEVTDINFATDINVTDDTDGTVTVDHANTGGASDVTSTAGQAVDAITFDGRGHVESVGTADFDTRYVLESGDTMTGTLVVDSANNTSTGIFVGDPANDNITDTLTFVVNDGNGQFSNDLTVNGTLGLSTGTTVSEISTSVGDPGDDNTLVTEAAVRTAIDNSLSESQVDVQDDGTQIVNTNDLNFTTNIAATDNSGVADIALTDSVTLAGTLEVQGANGIDLTVGNQVRVLSQDTNSSTTQDSFTVQTLDSTNGTLADRLVVGGDRDDAFFQILTGQTGSETEVLGLDASAGTLDIASSLDVTINGTLGLASGTTVNNISTTVDDTRNSDDVLVTEGALTSFTSSESDLDNKYVLESGDTMTGTLIVDSANNTNTGIFVGDPANDDITDTTTFRVSDGDATFDNTVTAQEFVETSTLRVKENVHRLEDQMNKVMQLQPVSFDWKDSGERSIGLLAEEVQEIFPELVLEKGGEAQGINYTKLTSVLVDAVKSMKAELDEIKSQI